MEPSDATDLRDIKARQDIYDCLMRYCRGIDRFDREVALSAYHDDAVDDHGGFVGPASAFIDWAFNLHATYQRRTQHMITNVVYDIDGDEAHVESYYIFRCLNPKPPYYNTCSGRYLDRFERRNGRWAIALRVCLVDIRDEIWAPTGNEAEHGHRLPTRDRNDPSYERPIVVDRSRFTQGS